MASLCLNTRLPVRPTAAISLEKSSSDLRSGRFRLGNLWRAVEVCGNEATDVSTPSPERLSEELRRRSEIRPHEVPFVVPGPGITSAPKSTSAHAISLKLVFI